MAEKRKIKAQQLKCDCQPENFDFKTTAEIKPFSNGIIGQKRAVKAMQLGFKVEKEGYNIYISGDTGTGRTTYARTLAREKSQEKDIPSDLCYVYNFNNSEKPESLHLPPGYGKKLQKDMQEMIKEIKQEIPQAFSGEEYEEKKREIMSSYQQKTSKIMDDFEQEIREKGFILKNTTQGPLPAPVDENNEPLSQEDFQKMDEEKRKQLRNESQKIQNQLDQLMSKIHKIKSEAHKKLKEEEKKIALSVIQPILDNLKRKYSKCKEIKEYLNDVQEDIIENINKFKNKKDKNSSPFPMMNGKEDFFKRYKINLLVDNKDKEGAPVIYESNPTYYNLFGKIEGEGKFGTITTDFTMIKGGSIHKANGGYLILNARDVLSNPFSWQTLKRTLINQEIVIENIGEQYRTVPVKSLKPEAIPVNIKVIMIGNPFIYQLLYNYDEQFEKLFKIKADFDVVMDRNQENMQEFASFIACVCENEKLKHFTVEAVGKVIEYSSRLTGDRKKMTTRFNELLEIIYEANAWSDGEKDFLTAENVKKAVLEKEKRANLVEEKILEMIERDHILVDVEGTVCGQINGLSVLQTGQYKFGRPSRITAQTYPGKEGVINIEREVKLSGKVHNKGVMIMAGFLGGKYAKDKPLSLSASLAFEQSYGGVDGDSASCAELIALLSAIAEIPVKQELAITGSMNQKGKVQPIGGVNEKVEGFYRTCKIKGLTGNQGVIIPAQNVENLMLKQEIIDAVEKEKFSIYIVKEIDQAIEIMLDKPAEIVHDKVKKALDEYASKINKFTKND